MRFDARGDARGDAPRRHIHGTLAVHDVALVGVGDGDGGAGHASLLVNPVHATVDSAVKGAAARSQRWVASCSRVALIVSELDLALLSAAVAASFASEAQRRSSASRRRRNASAGGASALVAARLSAGPFEASLLSGVDEAFACTLRFEFAVRMQSCGRPARASHVIKPCVVRCGGHAAEARDAATGERVSMQVRLFYLSLHFVRILLTI